MPVSLTALPQQVKIRNGHWFPQRTNHRMRQGFFSDFMTGLHDKLPDLRQKFRSQKRNIVNNRLVVGIVRKIAMSLANRPVLIRKFVKAIATQTLISPKPESSTCPCPAFRRSCQRPDKYARNAKISSLFVPVNVLKTPQKRRNVVARLGVELDVRNCPSRNCACSTVVPTSRRMPVAAESLPHLKNLCNPESPNQAQIQIVAYFMASTTYASRHDGDGRHCAIERLGLRRSRHFRRVALGSSIFRNGNSAGSFGVLRASSVMMQHAALITRSRRAAVRPPVSLTSRPDFGARCQFSMRTNPALRLRRTKRRSREPDLATPRGFDSPMRTT